MKKLEDIVLKRGDIVEFDDGDIWAVDGWCGEKASAFVKEVKSIKRPVKYETIYEKLQPILDKAEKEYLENVIRPFKNRIEYIIKLRHSVRTLEWIHIELEKDVSIALPYFKQNSMYKGMKVGKRYTIEELGLFE